VTRVVKDDDPDFLVNAADVNRAGYCHKAGREWFAKRGLSWSEFIRPGVSAKMLSRYEDGIANRVIEAARKRHRIK
jgi:hypothetical protein